MLDFLFTLAITHKYYNIFTRALHNVSNERNMLALWQPKELVVHTRGSYEGTEQKCSSYSVLRVERKLTSTRV
jgi:hypothetical protein